MMFLAKTRLIWNTVCMFTTISFAEFAKILQMQYAWNLQNIYNPPPAEKAGFALAKQLISHLFIDMFVTIANGDLCWGQMCSNCSQ